MGDLQNEFTWSFSRRRKFEHCRRAYFWQYYGSWGGWDREADPEIRRAYLLKQISTLDMWGGDVVHRVIEAALHDLRWGRTTTIGELHRRAREIMVRSWRESLNSEWEFDPKRRLNLFEHYYNDDSVNARSVSIRERVERCLENFRRSSTYVELQSIGQKDWLTVEDLRSFDLDGVKVWVRLDCAYRSPEGRIVILDWKSGRPSDSDREQLTCYAIYATHEWPDARVEDIDLRAVYLDSDEERPFVVSQADVDGLREQMKQSIASMRGQLSDVPGNVARLQDFPMTEERARCKRCNFQQLCFPAEADASA